MLIKIIKYTVKLVFVLLLLVPINLDYLGKDLKVIDNVKFVKQEKREVENISKNEKKEIVVKEVITQKKEFDEGVIGIIIFENGRQVNIYEIPTDNHMKLGAGKLINGSVLNESGNSILLSHRNTHFNILKNIKKDDFITIKTVSDTKYYKVDQIYVTSDSDPQPYKSSEDVMITLITCYPFINSASADERYIVVAHLVK